MSMTPEQVRQVRELEMTDRVYARFAEDLKDLKRKTMRLTLGVFASLLTATLAVLQNWFHVI
jgi:hypothetical protein